MMYVWMQEGCILYNIIIIMLLWGDMVVDLATCVCIHVLCMCTQHHAIGSFWLTYDVRVLD